LKRGRIPFCDELKPSQPLKRVKSLTALSRTQAELDIVPDPINGDRM
jgi:hypothetical protein